MALATRSTPSRGVLDVAVDVRSRRLALTGELDLDTAPLLEDAVAIVLADAQRPVEVLVEDLDFVDAVGLGVLVSADNELRKQNSHLSLIGPRRPVLRALTCARLTHLLASPR